MRKIFILFSIVFTIQLSAQNQLNYNLSVGDTFKVEQKANQHITQDLNGTEQIIENDLTSTMQFKVVNTTDESITMEMVFKSMKMLMSSPTLGDLLNADTSVIDSTDITSNMFRGTLNVPITMTMDKTGKIQSVTGGDKIIESMFKAANITQSEAIAASKAQFEKQFGSDALSQSFEQMTNYLTSKKIKINDTWTTNFSGNLDAKNTWTLADYNKDMFEITGIATTTMSSVDDNVTMVLSGTQQTTISGNSKTGLFTKIVVTGENSGETKVKSANMTFPTTIKSTIIYKIIQ